MSLWTNVFLKMAFLLLYKTHRWSEQQLYGWWTPHKPWGHWHCSLFSRWSGKPPDWRWKQPIEPGSACRCRPLPPAAHFPVETPEFGLYGNYMRRCIQSVVGGNAQGIKKLTHEPKTRHSFHLFFRAPYTMWHFHSDIAMHIKTLADRKSKRTCKDFFHLRENSYFLYLNLQSDAWITDMSHVYLTTFIFVTIYGALSPLLLSNIWSNFLR